MSQETTPFHSSEAATESLPTIDIILSEPVTAEADGSEMSAKWMRKLTSVALASALGMGVAITIGENKAAIGMNLSSATSHTPQNDEMSDFASGIAGMDIRVDCNDDVLVSMQNISEDGQEYITLGQVVPFVLPFDGRVSVPVTMLRESVCDTITNFDPTVPSIPVEDPRYGEYLLGVADYADAVGVVLHESEHIKQVQNEAEATCNSYQKLEGALVELGLDEDTANRATLISTYRQADQLMDSYLSEECAPGGDFDLNVSSTYVTPPSIHEPSVVINLPSDN